MTTKKKLAVTWLVLIHLLMLTGWLQCDGWSDKSFLGFLGFMCSALLIIELTIGLVVSVSFALSVILGGVP